MKDQPLHAPIKRTFEAKDWPRGSPKREQLNRYVRTSEYMPSERWMAYFQLIMSDGTPHPTQPRFVRTYRTKKLAELDIQLMLQHKENA